jgi:hypothetical protein
MDAYKRFHQLLNRDFSPLLRADGFKGSGNSFRPVKGERIDVIGVQGSRSGGECCVNLGAHFSFLPSEGGGRVTDPKKFREYDCTFRGRLHEATEGDHWWTYGTSDAEAEASLADLIDLYARRGGLFFTRFEPFPDVFERIMPADIVDGDLSKMPAAMTLPYAAMILARIMNHLGHGEKCRQFAEAGLLHVGRAASLQWELERLRDAG